MKKYHILCILAVTLLLLLAHRKTQHVSVDPMASEALAQLQRKVHILMHHLEKHHATDPRTLRLKYRWDGTLLEQMGDGAGATKNKETISICVKNAAGDIENATTGAYVTLHEVSHVCTESQGHTPEFWENFQFVLGEAVAAGIYHYQDFEKSPVKYCGSTIAHSPLTCLRNGTCKALKP